MIGGRGERRKTLSGFGIRRPSFGVICSEVSRCFSQMTERDRRIFRDIQGSQRGVFPLTRHVMFSHQHEIVFPQFCWTARIIQRSLKPPPLNEKNFMTTLLMHDAVAECDNIGQKAEEVKIPHTITAEQKKTKVLNILVKIAQLIDRRSWRTLKRNYSKSMAAPYSILIHSEQVQGVLKIYDQHVLTQLYHLPASVSGILEQQ